LEDVKEIGPSTKQRWDRLIFNAASCEQSQRYNEVTLNI
jgi:hypothetical protein